MQKRRRMWGWVFVAPQFIGLLIFALIPLVMSFVISFHDWDGIADTMKFVGVKNYVHQVMDSDFQKALVNTVIYSIMYIPLNIVLALILLSCLTGVYGKLTGTSPWDVFSMLTAGRLPDSTYLVGIILLLLIMVGMCTQERFFCQFLCPMGAVFAMMPILPSALFKRDRSKCPAKCGLCRKRCPAHLDIDGDTLLSGECICCHACEATCPRKNIQIGQEVEQKEAEAVSSIRGEGK